MKRLLFLLLILPFFCSGYAQTVENIRVTQEGEQLKITYRIGASTESQLFKVYLSCSMDGATKFEPEAVIGDVGENVVGGKSYYMVMWDVFEDVDEVIDPNITVRVELMNDLAAPITRNTLEEEPVVPEPQKTEPQTQLEDTQAVADAGIKDDRFKRNGFFSYSGMSGFGIPIGVSFGSLNNWGYYVTPLRLGIYKFQSWDTYNGYYIDDVDLHLIAAAGVTKHFVSGGPYRLHGYAGLGGHLGTFYLNSDSFAEGYAVIETGVVNVIGGFNLTAGIMISPGYAYPVNFVFGLGFVF
jgi:hypothetical protein